MTAPPHFVVRDYRCPECGAPSGHPCQGTRNTDDGHHLARILAATGPSTTVVAPPRRPYDRSLAEQHAVPAGHEDGDPRADEVPATKVRYSDAQRAGGLARLAVARALLSEHRATKAAGGVAGVARTVEAEQARRDFARKAAEAAARAQRR